MVQPVPRLVDADDGGVAKRRGAAASRISGDDAGGDEDADDQSDEHAEKGAACLGAWIHPCLTLIPAR